MRINYLAHLDPYLYSGGGETIMRGLLDAAKARGHEVKITSRDGTDRHADPNLWYLCDVYNCPMERVRKIGPAVDAVVHGPVPYIHHDNAHVDLCWFGFIPCNGSGMDGLSCHIKGGQCSVGRAIPLYKNARFCSFLSPLHRNTHIGALTPAVLPLEKTLLLFPLIEVDRFCNLGRPRDIENLSYGGHGEAKGYYNIMKRFPRGTVIFMGGNNRDLLKDGDGRWLDPVPHHEMPNILNRVQNYIHLPRVPEAFGLVVAEAALCGCNLIVNDRVGALSWGMDLKNPEVYPRSLDWYWEDLEKKMGF